MLPVQLRRSDGIVDVIAFFDDGSNNTLLYSSIAVKLGLKGTFKLQLEEQYNPTMIGRKKLEISQNFETNKCFLINNVRTMKI
jgi:hypothetical protein